jgi:EpsI family protein
VGKMNRYISKSGCIICLLVFSLSHLLYSLNASQVNSKEPGQIEADVKVEQIPLEFGEWVGRDVEGLGITSREILKLDRYIRRVYKNSSGDEVFLYIGYWKKQSGESQSAKHSPSICLPGNGWRVSAVQKDNVDLVNKPSLPVNTLVADIEGKRQLFMYWFFSGERTFAVEWKALLYIGLESYLHGRSDGGIVEIATPLSVLSSEKDMPRARTVAAKFIKDLEPIFTEMIKAR